MLCGTQAGYQRHRYYGTEKCEPCLDANARRSAEYRGGYKDGPRGRRMDGISDCVVDVLSTHLRWITREVLVDLVLDLHPEFKPESIRRALYRLVESGRVRVRPDANDPKGDRFEYFSDEWAAA